VPTVDAMTALRSCKLCSLSDSTPCVVVVATAMTFLPSGFVSIALGLRGFTGFDLRQRRISMRSQKHPSGLLDWRNNLQPVEDQRRPALARQSS
jgi:hypothetical protein